MTPLRTARALVLPCSLVLTTAMPVLAQQPTTPNPARRAVPMDPARAESLYVSRRPEDHPVANYARDMAFKARTDSIVRVRSQGVMDFQKLSYRSKVGDLDIPAYLWQPLRKRGPRGHAAMIWVHGGVHGNVDLGFFPFVRDAVERGYVIIAPEYRGSTGYGRNFHNAIDYGGYEVDDVMSAYEWLVKNLPHVDPERVGMMGWSHGGFITLHSVLRDQHPFKAAAAIVPVTNLVFRLSFKGPGYQRYFATQARVQGLPHEQPGLYIERSPLYQVPKLQIPLLVHVAINDEDVNFVEDQQLVWALRAQKPELAETKIYVDPPAATASALGSTASWSGTTRRSSGTRGTGRGRSLTGL
ncbi:MAG: S9 family peptidase [Gemmatimonadetes bacterium]|nr:S9 family peptidase [Gemmatimonadota bacterium]MBI2537755.1 S9 family peptidase [Gemmatimonadota bacterium]MBI3081900.1 S9 family peptidase [Gemmatimonadota bacterium]